MASLLLGLLAVLAVVIGFGGAGVVGVAASWVPVEEARLARVLVGLRRWWAVQPDLPDPVRYQRLTKRLLSIAGVGLALLAAGIEATGVSAKQYGAVLLFSVGELLFLGGWSLFVGTAFARAYDPRGSLPMAASGKVPVRKEHPSLRSHVPIWRTPPAGQDSSDRDRPGGGRREK
jgi:hypothetical protein